MKRLIFMVTVFLMTGCSFGTAFAGPVLITDLETRDGGIFDGSWRIYGVSEHAGHNNVFMSSNFQLLNNPPKEGDTTYNPWESDGNITSDLLGCSYVDLNAGKKKSQVFLRESMWAEPGNLPAQEGIGIWYEMKDRDTFIFHFNDIAMDNNYHDFTVRAERQTSSVPLPGALWLLGAGLIGVAGFRKKQ
ncbi:MAG: PEP-CTERM sorting domain-containing protein [Desulfobacteraceae bacterium]|nr:PEP-CTERM sorting domain-containing protein [Desulfobacteraceae bacterium]